MTTRTEADGGGTMTLRVVLPGIPPSVNHMYRRFTYQGRTMDVITRHAKAWMEQAAWAARQAALESGWSLVPKGQKVVVKLWFWWPNRTRRDTHNALKALLDAWQGVLYEDDYWVLPRVMDFGVDRDNPRIEAEVEVMEEAV